ncbi:LacI family DNA-binding transcriptional regulator [Microbacterium rhizomatis]|uniref:LacI family transcriptional regulator n=1 Tax=Microbacterium rhizomatis TaxID=1631477 RepID=A0A5J5IZR3_9MICO|nr:LacI family DNA-binding transcriptional regulator [Microbacterium rhizomatis]KAA9105028.1 LacI family transcriptional regulator [Microbacterium rhizomatis]
MAADQANDARRVGVRDVARLAGVSTQTVSRVINDHPHIRDDTRERVRDAMASLGYRVNNAARSLGTDTTRVLGVIASDATLYGPTAGIAALETAARSGGRWISTVYADAGDEASVSAAVEHVLAQGVDGIILVAAHTRTAEMLTRSGVSIPVAAMHDGLGAQRQAEAAGLVVTHLAGLGHRVIARLGGPADWLEERSRAAGFESALTAHGLAPGPAWAGDWSAEAGASVAAEVAASVRRPGGPTAVVVANDQMALGLISGLEAQGVAVPAEVSIAGFDDNPDAAYYRPSLTSVRLDIAGEAARCVATARGLAGSPPAEPRLVVRASTGRAPV